MSMIIKELGVSNFKSLKDELKCKLKKYTFLFGPNGAGKSTFLQAIPLLQDYIKSIPSAVYGDNVIQFYLFFSISEKPKSEEHSLKINFDHIEKPEEEIVFNSELYDGPFKINFDHIEKPEEEIEFNSKLYDEPLDFSVVLKYKRNSLDSWSINDFTSGFNFQFECGKEGEKNPIKIDLGSFKKDLDIETIDSEELKLVSFYNDDKERLNDLLSFVFQYTRDIRSIIDEEGSEGDENEVWNPNEKLISNYKEIILEHYQDLTIKYDLNEEIIFSDENNFLNIENLIMMALHLLLIDTFQMLNL